MATNILIDGLFLTQRYSWCGINRYLVNLLRQMGPIAAHSGDLRLNVLIPPGESTGIHEFDGQPGLGFVTCPAMRLRRTWRLGAFFGMINTMHAKALFLPSPAPLHFKPLRLAVTIHDVIPLMLADQFKTLGGRLLRHSVVSCLKRADLIFTDSEYSKNDMVSRCGTPPERIVVAPLGFDSGLFRADGVSAPECQQVLNSHGITRPYFLHVGVIEPRKNLSRLVRAYRLLASRRKSQPLQLVLCGRLGWGYQDLIELIREPDLRGRVVLTGPVSDSELAILYKCSHGCVVPSLYEGFGLPLLEAMASGVPVMSSDRSCLPEIGGDAVLYFNPESVEDIANAMERVLSGSDLRKALVQRGIERARQFSWEQCARKTLAALREL